MVPRDVLKSFAKKFRYNICVILKLLSRYAMFKHTLGWIKNLKIAPVCVRLVVLSWKIKPSHLAHFYFLKFVETLYSTLCTSSSKTKFYITQYQTYWLHVYHSLESIIICASVSWFHFQTKFDNLYSCRESVIDR